MKCGKAAGSSDIIAETLKAAGVEGDELVRKRAEAVYSSGVTPVDWEESSILNLYKAKDEALDRDTCCGLKLRSSHEAAGTGAGFLYPPDGEHQRDAVRLCAW